MKRFLWIALLAALILLPVWALGTAATPLSAEVVLDRESVDVQAGESVTIRVDILGGTKPIRVSECMVSIEGFENAVYPEYVRTSSDGTRHVWTPKAGAWGLIAFDVSNAYEQIRIEKRVQLLHGLVPGLSLDRTAADIAQAEPITATFSLSGGTAPYSMVCEWEVLKDEGWVSVQKSTHTASGSDTFIPRFGQQARCTLTASDSRGATVAFHQSVPLLNAPGELQATVSEHKDFDRVDILRGDSIRYTWDISGGQPPYRIDHVWEVQETDMLLVHEQSFDELGPQDSLTITPRYGHSGRMSLYVTDAQGQRAVVYKPYQTTGDPLPMFQPLIALDRDSAYAGESIQVSVTHQGGEAPYEISYYLRDEQGQIVDQAASDQPSHSFLATRPLRGTIDVRVRDAVGRRYRGYSEALPVTVAPARRPMGDANGSGQVDMGDLTHMVDYLVWGQPPLISPENADTNANGAPDPDDLQYVIDRLVAD